MFVKLFSEEVQCMGQLFCLTTISKVSGSSLCCFSFNHFMCRIIYYCRATLYCLVMIFVYLVASTYIKKKTKWEQKTIVMLRISKKKREKEKKIKIVLLRLYKNEQKRTKLLCWEYNKGEENKRAKNVVMLRN